MQIEPIEEFVFRGVQEYFVRVFGVSNAIWVTASDEAKVLDRVLKQSTQKMEYPFCFLRMNSMALSVERQAAGPLGMRGQIIAVGEDQKKTFSARIMPVDISVTAKFLTQDFEDVKRLTRRWIFASRQNSLSFDIRYGRTALGIKSVLETTVSIPTRDAQPTQIQEYPMEASFVILGFISDETLIETQVADTLEISAHLAAGGEIVDRQVWTINRPFNKGN